MITLSPYYIHHANGERRTANGERRTSRSRSGSALVIVLGMLSVLLLMGVAFSVTMRTERSGAANMRHAEMARHVLDSALVRTLSDLDVILNDDGDLPVPTNLVVAVSSRSGNSDLTVNVLSHEASRHLPGDQLAAALYSDAEWLPIYGGVRITTTSDQDPTSEDAPVGRYAYVILNGCGYLDPNVVAVSNRLFGMTPAEVDIAGEGGRILGAPGVGKAETFLTRRDASGHFVTMRDFLRPEITDRKPPLLPNDTNFKSSQMTFHTNFFSVGSMAVDDLTPSIGKDDGGNSKNPKVHIRLPKFPLVDDNGKPIKPDDLDAEDMATIADYFGYALSPTWEFQGKDKLPANFGNTTADQVPYEVLVARNLMDALDDDNIPGGSKPHKLENINHGSASDRYDAWAAKMGKEKKNWDRFPCTEPMPMLDNIVLVAGDENNPGMEFKMIHADGDDGTPGGGPVTNVVATLRVGFYQNSAIYVGWNVPEGAEGTYHYLWQFSGRMQGFNYGPNANVDDDFKDSFETAAKKKSFEEVRPEGSFRLQRPNNGSVPAWRAGNEGDIVPAFEFEFSIPNAFSEESAKEKIPENIGFRVQATGFLYKDSLDNDVRQVAPCLMGNDTVDDIGQGSSLEIELWFKKDLLFQDNNIHIVGGAFCLDPMFAYNKDSWLYSLSPEDMNDNSPAGQLRKAITFHTDDSFEDDNLNPIAKLYLKDPRKQLGNSTVFDVLKDEAEAIVGGCCDVMWANPDSNGDSLFDSARAFYIDPKETDKTSPYAFTRVGQLGFLPIGTYRTIALLDGWGSSGAGTERVPRQRVLDYFTMHAPLDPGTVGKGNNPGDPVRSESFTSRVNINPPRTAAFKGSGKTTSLKTDDYNHRPLAAVLNGCPLREWAQSGPSQMPLSWEVAETIAKKSFLKAIDLPKGDVIDAVTDEPEGWNAKGVVHDISVLGRCLPDNSSDSIDTILRNKTKAGCDFDREGVIRNTSEMLTARQQLFTILLKADSFTPKFGFNDAEHGTSLASVQAIAHIWRDPEPLRDADGIAIRDNDGNPIYPWVLLDMYQF